MKIAIYQNPNKDPDGSVKLKVTKTAEKYGMECFDFAPDKHCDFVVSIGGDGTILRVVKDCARMGVPILGINKGTVGFLTEIEPDGLDGAFEALSKRNYILERRALIDATIRGKHCYALNDVVVMRSGGGRVVGMEVYVNDAVIDKFKCDGYIAATPTGSTAYSLSAGGSVIAPNAPVIALTPINPHTLRTRPIVVGSGEMIKLEYFGAVGASVFVDGDPVAELESGESVFVTGWDISAMFVRLSPKNFYSKLLDKLNSWSASEE